MSNRLAAAAATKHRSAISMGESPLTPETTIRPDRVIVCKNLQTCDQRSIARAMLAYETPAEVNRFNAATFRL
jgi:hypothetical protein